jgi:hypothetical protein
LRFKAGLAFALMGLRPAHDGLRRLQDGVAPLGRGPWPGRAARFAVRVVAGDEQPGLGFHLDAEPVEVRGDEPGIAFLAAGRDAGQFAG